jgi:hypothetical protein
MGGRLDTCGHRADQRIANAHQQLSPARALRASQSGRLLPRASANRPLRYTHHRIRRPERLRPVSGS